MAVATTRTPRNAAVEAAAAVEPNPAEPLKAHFQRWGILVKKSAEDSHISANTRKILTEHGASIKSLDQLSGSVLLCYVASCFSDLELFKVQISVSPDLHAVGAAILSALSEIGATTELGGPPRTAAERAAAACLKQFR